jgi:hypothetical protein
MENISGIGRSDQFNRGPLGAFYENPEMDFFIKPQRIIPVITSSGLKLRREYSEIFRKNHDECAQEYRDIMNMFNPMEEEHPVAPLIPEPRGFWEKVKDKLTFKNLLVGATIVTASGYFLYKVVNKKQ